jgi:hypothetical protein
MSDPFATWSEFGDTDIAVNQKNLTTAPASQVKVLLPLSLLMLCIYGATMPWVLIRPFSASIRTYNITDVPGGIGILWTVICLSIPGIVLLLFRKQSGLFVVGLAAGVLGWMGTVLGLLLGVITSIIPSIDLAGIDMAKAGRSRSGCADYRFGKRDFGDHCCSTNEFWRTDRTQDFSTGRSVGGLSSISPISD